MEVKRVVKLYKIMEKEKDVFNLKIHETLVIIEKMYDDGKEILKRYEVTRVPGGWVYCFDYPGQRQSQIVFVPGSINLKE